MRFTTLISAGCTALSFATVSAVRITTAIPSATTTPTFYSNATSTTSSAIASPTSENSKLQWVGVSESGAEFGDTTFPGTLDVTYTWPNNSAVDILLADGMNIFRIPIMMERLVPNEMTGPINATYFSGLQAAIEHITSANAFAVIDSHNYGRYYGNIFTSTSDFQTYWTTVASNFANNSNVIFDCNNEFHDEPSNALVASLNQACITGVRAAGATSQYIFVEGTSYTGAWTWVSSGNSVSMLNLTDPSDKIIYEMHQYLDSDGSGTSATCVNSTIGADRIVDATAWLKSNGKKGVLGEFAGGANEVCLEAVEGLLEALSESSDVWLGAMWWAAGPWWADYIYSIEPGTGVAYDYYIDTLKSFM